ncbi:RNA polymerase sigma-70 factor, sigma-E family [Amycolatopsis arida]|uniref:RNA polymerase sigma-70 factor, sigma-E family n=1 Tax=Amycolatopsis arida TaxID=587909 RepID=A0A1I5TBG8_9PSEU|nr:SigE family RNA polymerase sigma factor [Amycolatopsis arida]TDX96152.1 RNA polymerase sigma-70 factor (sigma-E family) [Amycolatopsis arida]SFP80399.1 RNA polymerase sigma-70 factor, sigma-E family [Amycolatopsis arida]
MAPARSPWDGEFSQYFAARAHMLRSTAYLLCGDWHRAEDIAQTALVKLYVAWPRLSRHDALDAYARRVVVRTFLAENRRLWRRREQLTGEPPELPAAAGGDTGARMVLSAALAAVPPKQRAVLVLRYWEDLGVEETAAVLGCSTGTVKSQAARGLVALRRLLGPQFPQFGESAMTGETRR